MKQLLLVLFMFVASCGNEITQNKDRVVVAIASTPPTIDLQKSTDNISRAVFVHVYDSPMAFDTNGKVVPALATEWTFVDTKTLQLRIREGVIFHNGKKMLAEDVVASLNRLRIVPESQTMYGKITNVTSDSDNLITIHLSAPYPSIVGYLAHPKAAIYPKEEVDILGTNTVVNPIGTGPYKYVEYIRGERVVLKANPEYWDGAPAIENLEYKVIVDDSVRTISLETGEIQGVMDVEASQIDLIRNNPKITLYPFNHIGVDYLGMNATAPALQNKRLREAIFMAIDKQAIIDAVYFGLAKPASTLFDSRIFGAYTNEDPLVYDPVQAKKIIQEEGLEGYKLILIANEGPRGKIAEIIHAFLKEIGIDVEIRLLEWAAYLETLGQGKHELFLLGWSNSTYDADSSLHTIFHTDNIQSGYNNMFYSNPEVDRLIEKASIELDETKRAKLYAQVQEIIRNDRFVNFLFNRTYTLAFSSDLEGIQFIPTGDHKLNKLRFKK